MLLNYTLLLSELALPFQAIVRALWRPIMGGVVMSATLLLGFDGSWSTAAGFGPTLARLVAMILVGGASYIMAVGVLWQLFGRPSSPEQQLMAFIVSRRKHVL